MITVALWFLATLLVVAIVFIAIILYSQYQELKQKELKQKRISHNCRIRQKEFRDSLQALQKDGWLNPQQKQPIIMLANNFFVFQTVNEANSHRFYELINKLDYAINTLRSAHFNVKENLIEAFNSLATDLPKLATQYNAQFYTNVAPKLVDNLNERINTTLKMFSESERQDNVETNIDASRKDSETLEDLEELEKDAFDDYTKRALESHTQRTLSNEN